MEISTLIELVESLGIPFAFALIGFYAVFSLLRWLKNVIEKKLENIREVVLVRMDQNEQLLNQEDEKQMRIIVKLHDKIGMLQDDIIRMDTMLRLISKFDLDINRIGKNNKLDQNITDDN